MTFSIVGRCIETGMFGVAVSSSSPAVGARCARATHGLGASLTQNFTDPTLGMRILELMRNGASAETAVQIVASTAPDSEYRQLAAIGREGPAGLFTGQSCLEAHGSARSEHAGAVGNLLANSETPQIMVDAFEQSKGHLAHRLLEAMRAGLASGGEMEAVRSAGMMVVHEQAWPIVDLRVDWDTACPILTLGTLWHVWEPRIPLYLARAVHASEAPSTDDV